MASAIPFSDFCPSTDLNNLNNTLDTYGVAVVPNVFTDDESETLKQKVFKYLEDELNIKEPEDFSKLKPINGGILHSYGISLLKEVLDMKTDDRTIEPFRRIWNTDELTMSLDGMNIGVPPELISQKFFDLNNLSLHTDQSSDKKEMCCVQSFINLEHTENGDGCLSVLTNSHKFHAEFFANFKITTRGRDWYLLKKEHINWFISKGCEFKMITAPKGSIVLWDSRTIHMGTLPRRDRANFDRWRFIIYVCYTPARLQTKEDAKLKRTAYIQNVNTSHWPYGVRLFKRRDDDLKFNDLKNLTDRHKRYIGIN